MIYEVIFHTLLNIVFWSVVAFWVFCWVHWYDDMCDWLVNTVQWCRVRYRLTRRMNVCLAAAHRASWWGDRHEHLHYMLGANYYIEIMDKQRTHALPFEH